MCSFVRAFDRFVTASAGHHFSTCASSSGGSVRIGAVAERYLLAQAGSSVSLEMSGSDIVG